jgi:hypothetical protein
VPVLVCMRLVRHRTGLDGPARIPGERADRCAPGRGAVDCQPTGAGCFGRARPRRTGLACLSLGRRILPFYKAPSRAVHRSRFQAMKLEDLQPNAAVRGLLTDGRATVVTVQWHGAAALTFIFRDPAGRVAEEILFGRMSRGWSWWRAAGRGASTVTALCSASSRKRAGSGWPTCSTPSWRSIRRWWSHCPTRSRPPTRPMLPCQALRSARRLHGGGKTIMAGLPLKKLNGPWRSQALPHRVPSRPDGAMTILQRRLASSPQRKVPAQRPERFVTPGGFISPPIEN